MSAVQISSIPDFFKDLKMSATSSTFKIGGNLNHFYWLKKVPPTKERSYFPTEGLMTYEGFRP
jgi:hypothetical protein